MAGRYEDQVAQGGGSPQPSAFDGLAAGIAGLGQRGAAAAKHPSAFGWQDGADQPATGTEHSLPGLQQDERLPWLYSAEDDLDGTGVDPARVWAFLLTGAVLLMLIVGGVWYTVHRHDAGAPMADGSLIAAPPGPIKEAPQDPGGKTFDGTGDSSFAVSQGHVPGVTLAPGSQAGDGGAGLPEATQSAAESADDAVAGAGTTSGGVGVQIGAFSTQLAAEAAWARLAKAHDALSGNAHRIVAGKADIGTVYGLQALAGSDAAANALCDRLKSAGLNCQVKD